MNLESFPFAGRCSVSAQPLCHIVQDHRVGWARAKEFCCWLLGWSWAINVLHNLTCSQLLLSACLCPLVLSQQLFSLLVVSLGFSIPVLRHFHLIYWPLLKNHCKFVEVQLNRVLWQGSLYFLVLRWIIHKKIEFESILNSVHGYRLKKSKSAKDMDVKGRDSKGFSCTFSLNDLTFNNWFNRICYNYCNLIVDSW